MKKLIYSILLIVTFSHLHAQVGIGTNTPNSSAILELQSTDRGILLPRMTSAQRNAIVTPANGLQVFDINTNSFWYFNGTLWINTITEASYGDVKSGFQSGDHSGWVLLDGRAVSSLSANQQVVAANLGFGSSIPDATSAYLVQNGSALGTVTGSNTTIINRNNLPNVTLSGSTSTTGSHDHITAPATSLTSSSNGAHTHTGTTDSDSHTHTISGYNSGTGANGIVLNSNADATLRYKATSSDSHTHTFTTGSNGNHTHTVTIPADGNHSHTVTTSSINGGVTQQALSIAPQSLSVNMFVYLGQ